MKSLMNALDGIFYRTTIRLRAMTRPATIVEQSFGPPMNINKPLQNVYGTPHSHIDSAQQSASCDMQEQVLPPHGPPHQTLAIRRYYRHPFIWILEIQSSPTSIATSNANTTFHSVLRNGHLRLAKDPYEQPPLISPRNIRKQQTALHNVANGHNLELVKDLTLEGGVTGRVLACSV
ncbi:Ankyrin repeat-containing protein [Artemisia annua]|uniref:Ankyrin repeat-containing protein n=1 Tax=Artemisia annua TaxID=35608 RepID=A0A2U1PCS0_ARTAN|nr:Ankyrin repeat-containing protein [Artemisia annua]